MEVKLLSHTPNPEQMVAAAAKLCYSASSITDLKARQTPEESAKFVKMLAKMGHESPIEHVSFTFGIEGISRSLMAQITRHRIASFSVQSQRYVPNTGLEFVTPPEVAADSEVLLEFELAMKTAWQAYEKITYILKEKYKKNFLAQGMDEKKANSAAEKIAIEDARYVLPNAAETKMICTFNARSLINFFSHRCCNRAQWEIRQLAEKMLRLVFDVAPSIFSAAGPSCLAGKCPEGRMTCGKMNEVLKNYKNFLL